MLHELIHRLTGHELQAEDVQHIVAVVDAAPSQHRYAWATEVKDARLAALLEQLTDYLAIATQLDELHEQLCDWIELLPPFPPKNADVAPRYFRWLQDEIRHTPGRGGQVLLQIHRPWTTDWCTTVVHRADAAQIVALSSQQGWRFHAPATV